MEFIKRMNKMFEVNSFTGCNRVVVDYAPNCKAVVIRVFDKVEIIDDVGDYTELGLMFAIMDKVKEMY